MSNSKEKCTNFNEDARIWMHRCNHYEWHEFAEMLLQVGLQNIDEALN